MKNKLITLPARSLPHDLTDFFKLVASPAKKSKLRRKESEN